MAPTTLELSRNEKISVMSSIGAYFVGDIAEMLKEQFSLTKVQNRIHVDNI